MKQKHSTTPITEDVSEWSEVERDYAQMLLVLHRGCLLNQIPYTWGYKRKRSAIQDSSFPSSSSSSSSSSQTHHTSASKVNTSSPITPLSFPTTESDNLPTKISLKRKKEYYLQIIQDLTKTKAELNQELESVKHQRDKLKSFNLKLRTKEKQLISKGLKSECKIPNMEIDEALQLDQSLSNGSQNSSKLTAENEYQKLQLMQMQNYQNQNFGTYQKCKYVSGHQTTSLSTALGSNKGTLHLPDLNLPIDEEFLHVDSCQPLDENATNKDLSRAMAAQARQRRLQIFRLKKPIGF